MGSPCRPGVGRGAAQAGSHPGGRRAKTTTTRAEQGSRNQMPKQEEGEDDNPGGRERDCGSAEREPEGRGCTSWRGEAPPDNDPRTAPAQLREEAKAVHRGGGSNNDVRKPGGTVRHVAHVP